MNRISGLLVFILQEATTLLVCLMNTGVTSFPAILPSFTTHSAKAFLAGVNGSTETSPAVSLPNTSLALFSPPSFRMFSSSLLPRLLGWSTW